MVPGSERLNMAGKRVLCNVKWDRQIRAVTQENKNAGRLEVRGPASCSSKSCFG